MDVSIVILNYKSKGLVRQCVKTIALLPPAVRHEVIVVDNGSDDGVGEMLARRHPDVRFVQTGANLGYAAGNNAGIRAAKGRYVVIMNPDITVRPGAVDALVAFMDANPDVGMAGPKLVRPDGSIDESCFRFPSPAIPLYRRTPLGITGRGRAAVADYVMADFGRDETRDVDWLLGAVVIARRSAIEKVGMLDEGYFLYFEDTDWCRRFWEAGERVVFFHDATMVHYHERLSAHGRWFMAPLSKATRIHLASAIRYFRKWRGKPASARQADATAEHSTM